MKFCLAYIYRFRYGPAFKIYIMNYSYCERHLTALNFTVHPWTSYIVHSAKKLSILTQIRRFRTLTPVGIYQWLWNDAQRSKQHRRGSLLIFKSIYQIFNVKRDKKLPFSDCNSSLNSPMDLKWCTKLNVVYKRCTVVFQGHSTNFKVTRDKKITNFDPNWAFPDCNSSLTSAIDLKCYTKLVVV